MQRISENLVACYGDRVAVYTANGYNNEAFIDPAQSLLPPGGFELNGVHVRRFAVFDRLGKPLCHLQRLAYRPGLPGNQYSVIQPVHYEVEIYRVEPACRLGGG